MEMTLDEAVERARIAGQARRYPKKDDPRVRAGIIFSQIFPRFTISKGATIFTLGSCFARSVEEKLPSCVIPTQGFGVPKTERLGRHNGILNEYNPATMCQRVEFAERATSFEESCIALQEDGNIDLLLADYVTPTTRERLIERRNEVDKVYAALFWSEAIIITFDLIEAWYDTQSKLYVNRVPPPACLFANRSRFQMHILDFQETYSFMVRMVEALLRIGVRKILLTISPVPLEVTYSGKDCFMANVYSKSILIACANHLSHKFPQVDYFPGYEIVMSSGPGAYENDSLHVRDEVVEQVVSFMVENYFNSS